SYLFMLAGYTAAIVGFGSVADPRFVFDTAVSRVQEISLGIVCAAVVSRLLFPRHVLPVVTERIEAWLGDAADWAQTVLRGQATVASSNQASRKLAADTIHLVALTTHLPYDPAGHAWTRDQITLLEQHMTALVPVLSAIGDRLEALQKEVPALAPVLQEILAETATWVQAGPVGQEATAAVLRQRLTRLEKNVEVRVDWAGLLTFNLCTRLKYFIDIWEDCLILRRAIAAGESCIPPHLDAASRFAGDPVLHLDTQANAISCLAAVLGTLLSCAIWIGTGWNDGAMAAQMTAVFCSIFASLDNPLPALKTHTLCLVGAIVIASIYQFWVFPAIDGFPMLVLALAPFLVTAGIFMAVPVYGFPAFALCMNGCMFMGVEASYNLDVRAFLNTNLAAVLAGVIAIIVVTLSHTVGAEERVVRLLRAVWADVAQLAAARENFEVRAFVRRMVDRLGLLVPRLASLPAGTLPQDAGMLLDIRAGLNLAEILRLREAFTPEEARLADAVIHGLSRHFQAKVHLHRPPDDVGLLAQIDGALNQLTQPAARTATGTSLIHSLVGLRRCVFPQAGRFVAGPLNQEVLAS
ncbi:MAG TPA: FUSC family protein, partial [Verrucomicrobiae bacterium]